jgi:hypothetical protein
VTLVASRRVTAADLACCAWVVLWAAVAIAVALELRGLAELSETVGRVGRALGETGMAVGTLSEAPLVGSQLGEAAARIEEAGASARANARTSQESVERLTLLLGVAIAVIPSLPLLVLYLPARLARARDAQAVRSISRYADRLEVERFLAQRALSLVPFRRLCRVSPEPWAAMETAEGRRRLAAAELDRLGLRVVVAGEER